MPLFLCRTARSSLRITRRSCYWRRYYPSSYLLLTATVSCSFSVRAMSTTASNTITNPVAAIAQLRSTSNKLQNLRDIAVCARLAKQQGACILFLPECFGFIGESAQQTLQEADDPIYLENTGNQINDDYVTNLLKTTITEDNDDSPEEAKEQMIQNNQIMVKSLMCGLRTIAVESGLWISGGGIHVSGAPADPVTGNSRVYNTHVVINEKGVLQCLYRKIHLFDVSIPDKVDLRESKTTAGGNELVTCDSPVGTLGVTICYDLRFPEQYIPLVQKGAQILLVPSAFTVPTGAAHWHTLLRARAIESQCYVIAAAQYGRHNEKRESFGHSLGVDPWGKVVADAGGYPIEDNVSGNADIDVPDPPSIVTLEIDLEYVNSLRQRMPIETHRSNASF